MNKIKRIATMRNIQKVFQRDKQQPPRDMHEMSGAQLRKLARHLGILKKQPRWRPLLPEERAAVWADAREIMRQMAHGR